MPAPDGRRVDTAALKQAHPIEDVVARYGIELRPQGRTLVGRCPFHADGGRPNLAVFRDRQTWRCFRCNVGGDVLTLVELVEHVSFREAVARLGSDHVVEVRPTPAHRLAPQRPTRPAQHERSPDELAVLQAAVTLYHQCLLGDQRALAYVVGRGINRATIARCRVGYAAGGQLLPLLAWRGLSLWAALRTGLLDRHGREHLAGRIVVPELRQGRPTWLTGRCLDTSPADNRPKYLGLPGRKPLLGWEQARAQPTVYLVEGAFDFLVLRMWSYPVLALLGTELRHELLDDLRAFRRVYLVLDGDDAGIEATCKLMEQIGPAAVGVALPDDVKDVAELAVRPDGQAVFAGALLAAVGLPVPTGHSCHS
jgi:DNA primase